MRSCWRHRTTIENTSCSHRLCLSSSAVQSDKFIELLAPALLQIKILRAFLCIRLSSSAALTQSIVKKMFWVVAFYILAYNACKNIKARFLLKPCGAAGDIARRLRILRALIVFACLHQQFNRTNFIELPAPALLQIKILRAFLCIRLSSSAALTQSAVKQWFRWFAVFLYSCCPWATRI